MISSQYICGYIDAPSDCCDDVVQLLNAGKALMEIGKFNIIEILIDENVLAGNLAVFVLS